VVEHAIASSTQDRQGTRHRVGLMTSVVRGRPEVARNARFRRDCPQPDIEGFTFAPFQNTDAGWYDAASRPGDGVR
jgi:hypothetical protein